jgi:hypothetical protein
MVLRPEQPASSPAPEADRVNSVEDLLFLASEGVR